MSIDIDQVLNDMANVITDTVKEDAGNIKNSVKRNIGY